MNEKKHFPKDIWKSGSLIEARISSAGLKQAQEWLRKKLDDEPYRVVIVRDGKLAVEWNHGYGRNERLPIASAAKSIYSNILGIALHEKKIPSADARVIDYYPEMMDVPDGEGPKPGRYAFKKDRNITFRQLISNTSGYMKPGEEPGKVFHYQTYGMNILTHALAKIYGYYDVDEPDRYPGFKKLISEKLMEPIGAHFEFGITNFDLHSKARLNIYGNYCQVKSTALDLARLGWLWCNYGMWNSTEVVPSEWMRKSVHTAPEIRSNCTKESWHYGYGYWTNDNGKLWPKLPVDAFCASGADGYYISVFPILSLVVVQAPGPYYPGLSKANPSFLELIVDSCN